MVGVIGAVDAAEGGVAFGHEGLVFDVAALLLHKGTEALVEFEDCVEGAAGEGQVIRRGRAASPGGEASGVVVHGIVTTVAEIARHRRGFRHGFHELARDTDFTN